MIVHQVVICCIRRSFDGPFGVGQFIKIDSRCLESEKFKSGIPGNELDPAVNGA